MAEKKPTSDINSLAFLTIAEVAAQMRVSKMTVYRLVNSGELASMCLSRSYQVPAQAVREYLDTVSRQ